MKKTALLFAFTAITLSAGAQITLSSPSYSENFNNLGSGLPSGWTVYSAATSSNAGSIATFSSSVNYGVYADTVSNGAACKPNIVAGGFKNYPSANNTGAKTATCDNQKLFTDRALGVRQVSQTNSTNPNLEPGAAFVLKLANTGGVSNLNLAFKLQSLDSTCPRVATWSVDYAVGASPTAFTPATTVGTMTTGGGVFSNNNITVNFGSALDNKATNVWIRIVVLSATTGSGNRPSTAIDDVNLTWTGTPVAVSNVTATESKLVVLGAATSDNVTFSYATAAAGKYSLNIFDMTGRNVHTETVNSNGTEDQLTVNGLNLAPGMYIAKMTDGNTSSVARIIVQ